MLENDNTEREKNGVASYLKIPQFDDLAKTTQLSEELYIQDNMASCEPVNIVNLPLWPEVVRATPNGFLRSALFGVVGKGRRPYLEREEIHAQEGINIVYTGVRLDQGDLDVWQTILHEVRLKPLGTEIRITAYKLLKLLGKFDVGNNRKMLDRQLSRMNATAVDVKIGEYSYEGSLIDEVYRAKDSREYVICLNPKLCALFACDQFTQIEQFVRHKLTGQPLAQWLYGFYASHVNPYPIKIETLHKLCGSETTTMKKFTQLLRKALEAVKEACEENGEKFNFIIKNKLVYVDKSMSVSQQKHLNSKKRKQELALNNIDRLDLF